MNRTILIFIAVVGCIMTGCSQSQTLSNREEDKSDTQVRNNLKCITLALFNSVGENGHFPYKLSDLAKGKVGVREPTNPWDVVLDLNSNYFVSPGTGTHPGSISNVDEWTDYIYIGNNEDSRPDVPSIISPPENHHGKYGYVVMPGQGIMRLPASQVRALIEEPWLLATNETPDNVDGIKRDVIVNVPQRLRMAYTNVNNWPRPPLKW